MLRVIGEAIFDHGYSWIPATLESVSTACRRQAISCFMKSEYVTPYRSVSDFPQGFRGLDLDDHSESKHIIAKRELRLRSDQKSSNEQTLDKLERFVQITFLKYYL